MKNEITLSDALKIIDATDHNGSAIPFDISFRSLNRQSKTGGKLYEYKQVIKYVKVKSKNPNYLAIAQSSTKRKRNPNHFENRTRNVQLQNGDIRTIHIRLIISINGQKVIY